MTSRTLALGLSLSLLLFYLLTYSGVYHTVDELSALTVTASILSGQGVQVNAIGWDQSRTLPQNEPGIDGQLYSKKGIGTLTWPYTPPLFSEPLAMLGLDLALYGAIAFRRRVAATTGNQALALASMGLVVPALPTRLILKVHRAADA